MLLNKICLVILLNVLNLSHLILAYEDRRNKLYLDHIHAAINDEADPCEDFYDYACGNYVEQARSVYYEEITSNVEYKFNSYIYNLMSTLYQHDHQVSLECQSFVEKTRAYLESCLKEETRNLTKYFDDIKPKPQGEWPVWQNWRNAKTFEFWKLLGQLQSYGLNNVIINQHILIESDGGIKIFMEPFFIAEDKNTTLPDVNVVFVLLTGLNVAQNNIRMKEILQKLSKTDTNLRNILNKFQNNNDEAEEILYGELQQKYPMLSSYINELMPQQLARDTLIHLRNPEYFHYITEHLPQKFNAANLCNYLMLKFLYYLAVDSTSAFKSSECVKDLRNKMDLAVNYLYYHHKYSFEAKIVNNDIKLIMCDIIKNLDEIFAENHLQLTDNQVAFLRDKLRTVRLNIGNLPENVSSDIVEDFYKNIPPLDKNNYYKNHLLLLRHRFQKSLIYEQNQTHFIVNDNHVGSITSPFYAAKQNMIILPFGSLNYPLYFSQSYDIFRYSLLGYVLAHEFVHAFELSGLNYDIMGNQIENDILENKNFKDSLECLETQLPTDSMDERIADIVGIDIIYKAFFSKYPSIVAENNVWHKYFYLNLAQFFCGKSNVEFIDHDTDAQRLKQIVINSRGFAEAFNCPLNSTMNPSEKCRVY